MKQATLVFALLGAILLAGCGGNGDTTSQTNFNNGSGDQPFKPTTHLSHRSVVSNYFAGDLNVMDATQDRLTSFSFAAGSEPTTLQSSPDGTLTFVNNTGSNSISSLNNNLEAVKATINLGGATQSFVTSSNNNFGFAAVPSYSEGLPPNLPGAINRFNPTDGSLNTAIPFPYVNYLAMDPAQQHLLAFTVGDTADTNGDDNAYWVDLTTTDPTTGFPPIAALALPAGALSKPVTAFFSSDGTKAFILNCGTECGGASAPSVTEIDAISYSTTGTTPIYPPTYLPVIRPGTATVINQWPVKGAQSGLIDLTANKLYVAGNTVVSPTVENGFFTVIDLNAGSVVASIPIGNGSSRIIRNVNGIFWIGAQNCGSQSCITMVNPSSNAAPVLPNVNGDATGIALQSNSGEVYTIEGHQLHIYDKNGNSITSQYNTDIVGEAWDVLYIN